MTTQITSGLIADSALTADSAGRAKMADGFVTPAKLSQPLTAASMQATTSGTTKDFTSIPSWVTRITVILNGVSTNGTSPVIVQLGTSGGIEATSYTGAAASLTNAGAVATSAFSTGFMVGSSVTAASTISGVATLVHLGSNVWVFSSATARGNEARVETAGGQKTMSNTVDQLRLTTVNGTDTFDLGNVNIVYE